MSDRATDVLHRVLIDDMGVCAEVQVVKEIPCLQDAWRGVMDYELDKQWWWWFLDTFLDDPEEKRRVRRAADEVRATFLDLAKLKYAQTGEPTLLPEKLIRCLERRILSAFRPSLYEIGVSARRQPAARASESLRRLTTEESWRTGS